MANPIQRAPRSPTVTITMTEEIIGAAVKRDSKNCMIAETISSTVPNARNVMVDAATIRWSDFDKGLRYTYLTPLIVRDAILKFDLGEDIEPFAFLLRGAWVTGIRATLESQRISEMEWERVKETVKEIRENKNLSWDEVAEQMGINSATLTSKVSRNSPQPGPDSLKRIETWLTQHTGEKPAPRIKSKANRVSGPARLRNRKRGNPEIIGGLPPAAQPAIATKRKFGLRMFDWDAETKAKYGMQMRDP